MATPNLKPHVKEIEQQFVDLFYSKYMADQWGMEAGYKSVPSYWATMRMQLLRWQEGMDCDNVLCTESLTAGVTVKEICSGSRDLDVEHPCCINDARYKPL